jgi:hypothetical protein
MGSGLTGGHWFLGFNLVFVSHLMIFSGYHSQIVMLYGCFVPSLFILCIYVCVLYSYIYLCICACMYVCMCARACMCMCVHECIYHCLWVKNSCRNLSAVGLTGPIPEAIGNLDYLQVLDLSNPRRGNFTRNKVSGDLSALASLIHLRNLYVGSLPVFLPHFYRCSI